MREVAQHVIGGHTYKIGHWPVDKANSMLAFLVSTFGEGLSGLGKGGVAGALDLEIGLEFFAGVVKGLFSKITVEQYSIKMREICDGIICDGKAIEYNTHFQGRIFHLHAVAAHVLMHQYQDFLDELPALVSLKAGSLAQEETM